MTNKEPLQDPAEWDWDSTEVRDPVKNRRVVVSVAFPSLDFERVSRYAKQIGKRTSEFVREAALDAVPTTPNVVPFKRASTLSQGVRVTTVNVDSAVTTAVAYNVR